MRNTKRGKWEELEPLLQQIAILMKCDEGEALQHMGYSGSSLLSQWRKTSPPEAAVYAARGVLAELGMKPAVKIERQFDLDELAKLFCLAAHLPVPEEDRKLLLVKLSREMGR